MQWRANANCWRMRFCVNCSCMNCQVGSICACTCRRSAVCGAVWRPSLTKTLQRYLLPHWPGGLAVLKLAVTVTNQTFFAVGHVTAFCVSRARSLHIVWNAVCHALPSAVTFDNFVSWGWSLIALYKFISSSGSRPSSNETRHTKIKLPLLRFRSCTRL